MESGRGPGEVYGKVRITRKWQKLESMYKYLKTQNTLKFSNCVLLIVPINNNNYEQPIPPFVIILPKKHLHESPWCNLMLAPSQWLRPLLINVGSKSTRQRHGLLINVYVNIQTTNRRYSQQWRGLEDTILHLQLPIVY